jgi:hypothetical protein
MGTKILVLGLHTLGLVLALAAIQWLVSPGPVLPFYAFASVYWLYSAWQIVSGRDGLACKVEALLNRRQR